MRYGLHASPGNPAGAFASRARGRLGPTGIGRDGQRRIRRFGSRCRGRHRARRLAAGSVRAFVESSVDRALAGTVAEQMSGDPMPFVVGIHQDVDPAVAPRGLPRPGNERSRCRVRGGIVMRPSLCSTSIRRWSRLPQRRHRRRSVRGRPHAAKSIGRRDILAISGRAYARDSETQPSWTEVARPSSFLPRRAHFIAALDGVRRSVLIVDARRDARRHDRGYPDAETGNASRLAPVTNAVLIHGG